MSKAKYLFFDIETTCLEPMDGEILEYAAIVVDAELRQIGDPIERVLGFRRRNSDDHRDIDEVVQKMHADSGLWDDCYRSQAALAELETDMRWLANGHGPGIEWAEGRPILAGSSIHFDRAWLRHHVPAVVDLLHHRMLDVSSLKLLRADVLGVPFGSVIADNPKHHRALADAMHSLDEARTIAAEITAGKWNR